MLAYIKGELVSKQIGYAVIDVGGLGYKVFMSEIDMDKLGNIGEIVKVHTYFRVSEDDISIFGFISQEELRLFELLISVSGIGAKSAITILGSIETSELAIAIISEDINTLKGLPGIGAKSAQRIILELKDKMKKEQQIAELNTANTNSKINKLIIKDDKVQEAISALQVLGYLRKDIETVIEKINVEELSLEDIIKQGLKELSKK